MLPHGAVRRFGDDRFRHPGFVVASALSPDGKRLATVSPELLQIADTATGLPLRRIALKVTLHFATPDVSFSPDGRYVACCLSHQLTAVWRVNTGEEVLRFKDRKQAYSLCQFLPDGKLVLTEYDRTQLFEVPSDKPAATWPIGGIARLSANGKTFAKIERERVAVQVGEAETGKVKLRLEVSSAADGAENGLALSPDGSKVAVVHGKKEIQVWDVHAGNKLASMPLEKEWIEQADPYYTVAFSEDGKEVRFGAKQGDIYRWQAATGERLPWLHMPWGWYVRGMHSVPDGRTLLATEGSGRVVRWDLQGGQHMGQAPGRRPPLRIGLTADGKSLVTGDWAGRIDLWEIASGRLVRTVQPAHDMGNALKALAVSPDGDHLALGEGGARFRLLRLADGKAEWTSQPEGERPGVEVSWLAFTPDGRTLGAGNRGRTSRTWDLGTGRPLWSNEDVAVAAVSPDSKRVVLTRYNAVTIVDAATGAVQRSLLVGPPGNRGFFNAVSALAFAPDGGLACGLHDGRIALSDAHGRERARFPATDPQPFVDWRIPRADHPVTSLAYSPDGQWLLSGSGDRSVRVWETATRKQVFRFDGDFGEITQVLATPDGRSAVSADKDGLVTLWDLLPAAIGADTIPVEDLWRDAAGDNAEKGYRAAWSLVTTTDARRRIVRERLLPAGPEATPDQLKRWIADLGSDRFPVREGASRDLSARVRRAEPLLQEALAKSKDVETKRRLESLVALLNQAPPPDDLRALRLVHAAELAGSVEARSLLEGWAKGAPEALLTGAARDALTRLERARLSKAPDH
jgi:WD40 repeat protein